MLVDENECNCALLIKILAQMYAYFLVMNSKRCKIDHYFCVTLFTMLYRSVLNFEYVDEVSGPIQMKAIKQSFLVLSSCYRPKLFTFVTIAAVLVLFYYLVQVGPDENYSVNIQTKAAERT